MPSPWPLGAGLFTIFSGLLGGWLAWFYPRTGGRTIAVASARRPGSMTPTEARLWLILWVVMGLGMVGIGVTIMRHAQGRYVVIPASAPFIDHLIWVGSWVCLSGDSACLSCGRSSAPPKDGENGENGENGARVANTPATRDGTSQCALRLAF